MTAPETVYFDHNATSPLLPCAREALLAVLDGPTGNPSSVHRDGAHARAILDRARATLADLLGARPHQIVFTGGGTESNNLAIAGGARAILANPHNFPGPVFATSTIEHPSVLACIDDLESRSIDVQRVSPSADGLIPVDALSGALGGASSGLISMQLANHETGALHPIRGIADTIANSTRTRGRFLLHCDAVQGFGKVPCLVDELGVDLMSISAHKLGGPIGIGALFVRDPALIGPVLFGGQQEGGLRPGTASPALASAFAAAAEFRAGHLTENQEHTAALRDRLREKLKDRLVALQLPFEIQTPTEAVPNTLSVTFPNADREALLVSLDLMGFRVSAGAACSSGASGPSPVLLAMGRDENIARSTVRISLGPETPSESIDRFVDAVGSVLPRVL